MSNVTGYWADGVTLREQVVDNGDGTGTRTVFDADGNVESVEQLSGLPIPELEPQSEAEQIADLRAVLDALLGADNG